MGLAQCRDKKVPARELSLRSMELFTGDVEIATRANAAI
jgi:hypothetical protein